MAVFDTVRCFYALPFNLGLKCVFQTRDIPEPAMRQYILRADGQLWRDAGKRSWKASSSEARIGHFSITEPRWVRDTFSGTMRLSAPLQESHWLNVLAVFENGQLQGIGLPEEERNSLSTEDRSWLAANIGSETERTWTLEAALHRWQAQAMARREEEQALSSRVTAIADSLILPCVEAGWGAGDELLPFLQAAASSIAADWDQHRSDQDQAKWVEAELAAWFGREPVNALLQQADLLGRLSEALRAEPDSSGDSADTRPETSRRYWNYRVFRVQALGVDEPTYELREAHYEGGRMVAWSQQAATLYAESLEGLSWALQRMLEATSKPVVDLTTNADTPPASKRRST